MRRPAAGRGGTARPLAFDASVAHQARMYDYMLGGKGNYAADREATGEGLIVGHSGRREDAAM